jgi:molybdenum cofactor biosynthesis enzyme MoaA
MIAKENIRIVHVEASSRCNSHCPMCSRFTADGFIQPGLVEGDLTSDVFYKLFTLEFTSQLEHVYFSGVYGDPCLNKLLPEFVNYLMDNGCRSISIDTNGGYRDTDWWASMARDNVMINFALDGTDNEALGKYRMGVKFDKVFDNIQAFISAGGVAQWNFIVFEHNEHQVETAKKLSNQIGAKFRLKVTQKFNNKRDYKVMKEGKQVFTLQPPKDSAYRHSNVGSEEHTPITLFNFEIKNYKKLNENKVTCKSLERQEVFLSASGLLFPCCYIGTYTHDSPGSWQFNKLYDIKDFDLNNNSVEQVLEIQYNISNKWNDTVENGNLITCLKTCGSAENTTLYYNDKLNKQNILTQ